MARITTSLGGGPTDATGTYATISTATDIVSAWTPASASGIAHGGFDSTGVTMNTTIKPIRVVAMYGNTGGTSGGGNSAASFLWQLADGNDGAGTRESVTHTTSGTASVKYANNYNTTAEYDTSTLAWSFITDANGVAKNKQVVAGTTYYYGFRGGSSGNFVFARGGTGTIWVNGTASTAWANSSVSAAVVWDTVPNAPTITSVTINNNMSVNINWNTGTDDGMTTGGGWDDTTGAHITGYNIVYKASTDSAWKVFKGELTSWTNQGGTTNAPRSVTNLTPDNGYITPGVTYNFMIAALNKVTYAATTSEAATPIPYTSIQAQTGTRSSSSSAKAPGGIWTGSTWNPLSTIKVRNASNAWISPATVQVYTGSTWKRLY